MWGLSSAVCRVYSRKLSLEPNSVYICATRVEISPSCLDYGLKQNGSLGHLERLCLGYVTSPWHSAQKTFNVWSNKAWGGYCLSSNQLLVTFLQLWCPSLCKPGEAPRLTTASNLVYTYLLIVSAFILLTSTKLNGTRVSQRISRKWWVHSWKRDWRLGPVGKLTWTPGLASRRSQRPKKTHRSWL